MGWVTDRYFRIYKADVSRDDLKVIFQRLYTDARDIMSDSPQPSWQAEDKFIITVIGRKKTVETEKISIGKEPEHQAIVTKTTINTTGEFEIRTSDKRTANWIWWLAKKQGLTFEQLKAMETAKKFK